MASKEREDEEECDPCNIAVALGALNDLCKDTPKCDLCEAKLKDVFKGKSSAKSFIEFIEQNFTDEHSQVVVSAVRTMLTEHDLL